MKNNINHYNKPSGINIQESKIKFLIILAGNQIFENVRKGGGGGLLTAIDQDLCPVLISNGNEKAEIIVAGSKIRIINGYGPQKLGSAQRSTQEQSNIIQQF